jgi:hypothetical protein
MLLLGLGALTCFGCGDSKTPTTVAPEPERHLIVGMGDQNPGFLSQPLFQQLGIEHARLIASYDTVDVPFDRDLADAWLAAARQAGAEPFVAFGHSRRAGRQRHLPSVAEYRREVRRFLRRYPAVRLYAAWNEPNNQSQPTDKNPKRAAQYANALRQECPDCTLIAGDVLDEPDAPQWLTTYSRFLKTKPAAWGIHDYSATNRFEPQRLKRVMAAVSGPVWLTETGGVAQFGKAFPYDLQRQARATQYVFTLARREPRIARVYLYNWTGAPRSARFDAGLTNPDGSPRPAFEVVRRWLRPASRSTASPSR